MTRIPLYLPEPRRIIAGFGALLRDLGDDLEGLELGGGTAVQAREEQRKSTDIDLFCSQERLDKFLEEALGIPGNMDLDAKLEKAKEILDARSEIANVRILPTGFICDFPDGPASLEAMPPLMKNHMSHEVEEQTGIGIQRTAQILNGKLGGRIPEGEVVFSRDGHDIASIHRRRPAEFRAMATESLSPQNIVKGCIAAEEIMTRKLAKNPTWQGDNRRPLLEVKDPELVPPQLWEHFHEALDEAKELAKQEITKRADFGEARDVPGPPTLPKGHRASGPEIGD